MSSSRCNSGTSGNRFDNMIRNCLEYAQNARAHGLPVVGIMCEYTPREVIMAAGAVPVCLCGGSASTIPAAEEDLPPALCPLIKSTYGYHMQGSNPFLEMADLIVGETTCDGKKKMFELMGKTRPVYVLELPQKQDKDASLEFWVEEVKRLSEELECRFGVSITDDKLHEAVEAMNRERSLRRQLAELMKGPTPPFTGRKLLGLKSSISCIPEDISEYESILEALTDPSAVEPRSEVRVLLTGVPVVHGAERVLDIIEDHGGLVVSMENCTGVKPILEDVNPDSPEPIRAIAEKYYHLPCSVMTRNDRRIDSLRRLARDYGADCIIEIIWQGCLTYDIESVLVKRLAENELGVPYLKIETDYSPSDSARITVRVEALFETVRNSIPTG
ncbi:double-cubane-cluster-containing anaerobic reductase [Candidatus Hydrogenedentota bacterium]